jgi:hypothetical protein
MLLTSRGTVSFPSYTEADARVLDTVDRVQAGTASWALCGSLGTFDSFLGIGRQRGPGLADEQDRAPVVPAEASPPVI